ncbi:MAG: Mur ligase family protein [Candidatus Acetothermia bacterium]|nr:Mur ligase family protein [Candidatus Acetothermia bacterium]MDH7504897.1 Mur ligase family protein [Candidatus Acetothermia bacterium]
MGKRVSVLGAGRSGLAAARLLYRQGARVLLSDHRSIPPQAREELEALGLDYEEGGHTERILDSELIVLSPGVPLELPILGEARRRGIPIIGELELAYRFCKSRKIIAVTGTKGKSTTAKLIGELLLAHGHRAVVAGNIGRPLSGELARIDEGTIVVLEVSSFQLESIADFHPWVSLFLNFAPDHLERHGSLENCFRIKCRIFENQTEEDFAIVHRSLLPRLPRLKARLIAFGPEDAPKVNGLFPHLREDLAAALCAARLVEPGLELARLDLERALAMPHRLEFVAEIGGVKFYDDSKATNVLAALAAIAAFPHSRLTLILGGRAKGESFAPLAQAVKERGIAALLIGEAAIELARELERLGHRQFRFIRDFHEAARLALELGNEVCLLSPACASFDMFADYAARGEAFQEAVRQSRLVPTR